MTYLPRANEPVEPHVHTERAADGTWGCPTCIEEEAAATGGGGGGGGVGPAGPAGPAGATGPAGPAGPAGADGAPGVDGAPGQGVKYVSTVMRVEDLPATASPGDMYWVETPAPTTAFIWDVSSFVAAGRVQGEPGADGAAGAAGADGAVGAIGPVGPAGADGAPGADGVDGVSISIQGTVATYAALPADALEGDCYVVEADGLLYDSDGAGFPPEGSGVPWRGQDGAQGQQGLQGPPGLGITFKGTVATDADLPASATSGDLYIVSEPAPAHGFVWDGDTSAWVDAGPVQGPQGIPGEQGVAGVAGSPGKDGADSTVPGPTGPAGPAGADSTVPGPQGPKGDPGDPATLPISTATVLGGVKVGAGLAVTADGTLSASGGGGAFLPLAGGTLTGTLTLPSGTPGLAINGTNYNMLGGSGGVAFRSGTSNIVNHTGAEITNYVPLTTPGTGVGVRFGSGGPNLSKSPTGAIASSAQITVAAAPVAPTELANKAYVDSVAGGGGVTNPVAGSVAGLTLWLGSQSEYDAIGSKSESTLYYIK